MKESRNKHTLSFQAKVKTSEYEAGMLIPKPWHQFLWNSSYLQSESVSDLVDRQLFISH
jgi:hypothetical protein